MTRRSTADWFFVPADDARARRPVDVAMGVIGALLVMHMGTGVLADLDEGRVSLLVLAFYALVLLFMIGVSFFLAGIAIGRLSKGRTILEPAISLARAENDSGYLLELLFRQGGQLAAFGHIQPAEPILNEALALAEARADSFIECQVLRWIGFVVSNLGRLDEAEQTTRRQIELAEALGLHGMIGWARVGLGWYASQRGHPEAAVAEYREAVEIFRAIPDSTGELAGYRPGCLAVHDRVL